MNSEPVSWTVSDEQAGQRLDAYLAARLPQFSRVHLQKVVLAGGVRVSGEFVKASFKLKAGQTVAVVLPELPREAPIPEEIPLSILFEDDHFAVVNKPAGMVVHPAKGHWSGTLTCALAFHFEKLSSVGGAVRPGIVHRLDRETSGVIAVAKTDQAHLNLAAQFEARTVEKEYFALLAGQPNHDRDWIDQPIGPHPYQREKMAIRSDRSESRPAQTFYEVQKRYGKFTQVKVVPKTGRTHQIRLHMAHLGCPVLCDRLYGGRSQITYAEAISGGSEETLLDRLALHALRLKIDHPVTGQRLEFAAPLPEDLNLTLKIIRGTG